MATSSPSLAAIDHLDHLRTESRRFRDVLASCPPQVRVPSCPGWDASDLLWHLATVQRFWAWVLRNRPASPQEADDGPERPGTHEGLLAAFDEWSADLAEQLASADGAEEAWTWAEDPADHSVGFIRRRQAHEALIHRLDAELAAGTVTPLDARLAADGVLECLDVMFGGCPSWGEFAGLPHHVRVDLTDVDETVWVQIGRFTGTDPADSVEHDTDDIRVVADPGRDADACVSGPAGAVDAWLWRRGDDSEVHVTGDRAVYDHFRLAVNHPIT